MTVFSHSGALGPAASWEKLGFDEDPVPGDPRVLQGIVNDFTFLRDVAWAVSQGLDAVVASAASGGFEGETADTLREVISGRLKTFVYNIARAFSLAGEAVAEYRSALVTAQQAVAGALEATAGLAATDPKLGGLRNQVCDQLAAVRAAEAVMIRALEDASTMVSQPIKVPSLFDRIWKGVKKALNITAMVLSLASIVVDGPLGIATATAATEAFAMTLTDYIRGRTTLLRLGFSIAGLLMPTTKGIWSLEELGSGLRGFVGAAGWAGGKTAGVLASPTAVAASLRQSGVRTWQALSRVPGLVLTGARAVPGALRGLRPVIAKDFGNVQEWYPELTGILSPHGAYVVVNLGRVAGALFTPMTIQDMARFGFRGAWRQAWARASLTNTAQAFSAGWTSYGARAAHAGMEVWQMLHSMRPFPPEAKGVPKAGPRVVPGSVKWTDTEDWPREPVVPPVTMWMPHDPVSDFIFMPSTSGQPLFGASAARTARSLDTLGTPESSRLWPPAGGEHTLLETLFPPTPQIVWDKIEQDGANGLLMLNTRSGLLVPVAGVLSDQGNQLLRENPQIVEKLANGEFEPAAGLADSGVAGNGVAGRPVQPADVQGVPQAHLEARQVLDLLNAETAAGVVTRQADRMMRPAPRAGTHTAEPAELRAPMRVERYEGAEQGQASHVAGWGPWLASVMRYFWHWVEVSPGPESPFRESLAHAERLVEQVRAAAREGQHPGALLQQVTELRSTAYRGLLRDAEPAVREFAHTPGSAQGLVVKVPVPGAPEGATAEYRFSWGRALLEWLTVRLHDHAHTAEDAIIVWHFDAKQMPAGSRRRQH